VTCWLCAAAAVRAVCPVTQLVVIRCAREHLLKLWAAVVFINSLKGAAVAVRIVSVSGTCSGGC
jgi:RNase P/RNase MRP subunit POP5